MQCNTKRSMLGKADPTTSTVGTAVEVTDEKKSFLLLSYLIYFSGLLYEHLLITAAEADLLWKIWCEKNVYSTNNKTCSTDIYKQEHKNA